MDFIECLTENVKNLSVTLLLLEKKSEKALLSQIKLDLEKSKNDSILSRLNFLLFETCNQVWVGLDEPVEKDHCIGCVLKYLTNTDYIEPGKLLDGLKELVAFRVAITDRHISDLKNKISGVSK
jgi:hypothetical protein